MLHESYIGSRRARFSLTARKSAMPFIYRLFIWPPGSMTTVMRNASAWLICWRVNISTPVMTCPKSMVTRDPHAAWREEMSAKWRERNTVGDSCGVAG